VDVLRELTMTLGLDVDAASFAKGQLLAEGIKGAVEGLADFAKEAVRGLGELVKGTAEHAHEIEELRQRTGIAAETLQAYGYAAGLSGVSTEELAIALGHLAKTGVKDLDKGLLSLADRFAAMPDGGEKTALALEKFGRAGGRLIPFLNRGREGIAELTAEAESLGVVLDASALGRGEEYAEGSKKFDAAIRGLKYTIGEALLPAATKTLETFRAWAVALRKLFDQARPYFGYLKAAFVAVASVITGVAMKAMTGWIATQLAAAGAADAFGLASLAAGAKAAGAALLAIAPWALLAGLIILLADDIETFFTGGDSLLGRYGEKWTHFLDAWTRGNPDDFIVVRAIKAAIHALSDLQGTYEEFRKTFFGNGGDVGSTATYNPDGTPTGHRLGEGKSLTGYLGSFFGSPAGPTPAAAGGTVNNFSPAITVHAGAGADGNEIGTALTGKLETWWQGKVNDTTAAGR
jgi:hypothetical protein